VLVVGAWPLLVPGCVRAEGQGSRAGFVPWSGAVLADSSGLGRGILSGVPAALGAVSALRSGPWQSSAG